MDKANPMNPATGTNRRTGTDEQWAKERPTRENYRGEHNGICRERCGGGYRVSRKSADYHGR